MESKSSSSGQKPTRRSSGDKKKKEEGSSSSQKRPEKRPKVSRPTVEIDYETSVQNLSPEGQETLKLVNRNSDKPCTFSDCHDPNFTWLRSGWIVEERRESPNSRKKKYFYDPQGKMYATRGEVDAAMSAQND